MMLEAYTQVTVAAGEMREWIHNRLSDLFRSETGATAAEYGVLVALIAAVIIAGATILGDNTNTKLTDVGNSVGGA